MYRFRLVPLLLAAIRGSSAEGSHAQPREVPAGPHLCLQPKVAVRFLWFPFLLELLDLLQDSFAKVLYFPKYNSDSLETVGNSVFHII